MCPAGAERRRAADLVRLDGRVDPVAEDTGVPGDRGAKRRPGVPFAGVAACGRIVLRERGRVAVEDEPMHGADEAERERRPGLQAGQVTQGERHAGEPLTIASIVEGGLGVNEHGFEEAWDYYGGGADYFTRRTVQGRGPVSWWHNRERIASLSAPRYALGSGWSAYS